SVRCIRDGRVEILPGPVRVGAVWGIDDQAPNARRKTPERGRIREASITALAGSVFDVLISHDGPRDAVLMGSGSEGLGVVMDLITEPYTTQEARWPQSGRHILAQLDAESVIVYQAYRPAIGHFAAEHSYFGGEFRLSRMSWIKPNFLWMMYRCGWGTREGQE